MSMTNRYDRASSLCVLAGVAGLAMASPALGQAPASSFSLSGSAGQPEFVDPKTGQVWTPENVGGKSGPNTPADRAFDPLAQATVVQGVVVQNPLVTPLGTVPITAGPTVPLVTIESTSLRAIPAQRWQVVMYLNNNSAGAVNPVINCRFTNAGNPVEDTRAVLPPTGPGARVGFIVYGPRTTLFVDHVSCGVIAP
jgi:hypothetical protein